MMCKKVQALPRGHPWAIERAILMRAWRRLFLILQTVKLCAGAPYFITEQEARRISDTDHHALMARHNITWCQLQQGRTPDHEYIAMLKWTYLDKHKEWATNSRGIIETRVFLFLYG